jgi:proteasome beta subunit
MSTVVGIACAGGVVLAGDRVVASAGRVRSRSRRHVHDLDGAGVGVVCDDVSGFVARLEGDVRSYRTERGRLALDTLARLAAERVPAFGATALVTAPVDDRPGLRSIDAGGGVTDEPFATIGSGAGVALGSLEAGYDAVATLDDAEALAREAFETTAARDAGTGTLEDVYRLPG